MKVSMLALTALLLPAKLYSLDLKIHSLCNEDKIFQYNTPFVEGMTVGQLTLAGLEEIGLEYQGYEHGIISIFDSPTGDAALEIISDDSMRSYGWCYTISSFEGLPGAMPDELELQSNDEVVTWYYGYAEMKRGQWISYCDPVYLTKPEFICQ